jgi:hypothetical protein
MLNPIRAGIAICTIGIIAGCQKSAPSNPIASPNLPVAAPIAPVNPSASPTITLSPVPTVFFSQPSGTSISGGVVTGNFRPSAVKTPAAGSTPVTTIMPLPSGSSGYQVIDEQAKTQFVVDGKKVLTDSALPSGTISFAPDKMLAVLTNTRAYFRQSRDPKLSMSGILSTQGVTPADTIKTLDFAIETLKADLKAKRPSRLQDPNFIRKNFRTIKWSAADPQKPEQSKIRITKYAVFTHPGSRTKTEKFDTALYSLKDPTAKPAPYTKQEVLSGIYEPGGKEAGNVEPIAYLTRDGLEEALMEGTVLIKFNDGTQGFFNVDRSNEIAYVKGLDRKEQKRYWYFKPVDRIKGYGQVIGSKISIEPGVTFAGDVLNIGLGKLVVISSADGMRMGAIADTGGAFLPNLHQLDYLAGTFDGKAAFDQAARKLPEYVTAYFLIKK